jgi:transketolase
LILTVEEHSIIGGFGGAVAEVIAEMPKFKARFKRVGIRDTFTDEIGSRE